MKTISFINHKGGVGKTTTAATIGSILADKKRVLMVDLDAQCNLTYTFIKERQAATVYNVLQGENVPPVQISKNLYLLPSSLNVAGAEFEIVNKPRREYIIKDYLSAYADKYDYVIIDAAPSLGIVTVNALTASNYAFIPTTAEALPLEGLQVLTDDIITPVQKNFNNGLQIGGIFFTRWNGRNLNKIVADAVKAKYKGKVLKTVIRENIAVAEAVLLKQTINNYAPKSNGAKDYGELAKEITKIIR